MIDQKKFTKEVFALLKKNDVSVRTFCALVPCSPATLYRGLSDSKFLNVATFNKIKAAVAAYTETTPC